MTRVQRLFLGLLFGFLLPTTSSSVELLPLESFASPPEFADATLSPDGRYLAVKAYQDDRYLAVIYDLDNLDSKVPLVMATDPWSVTDLKWANDDRILISVHHFVKNFRVNGYVSQLTAFNADGSDVLIIKSTGKKVSPNFDHFLGDRIVDLLPSDPEHVLVSWNPDDFTQPRLYKLNVYTSKLQLVQRGRRGIQSWVTDQEGRVRIGLGIDGKYYEAFHRPTDSKGWQPLFRVPLEERRSFRPVLIDSEDPDVAYVLSDFNADTTGLYKYRLSSASFVAEIFRDPDYDVLGVVLDRNQRDIQSVLFLHSDLETIWLHPEEPALLQKIRDRLPGLTLSIVDKSEDYQRIIIYASASDRPGLYYFYEPGKDDLRLFAPTYPGLQGKRLSTVRPMTYEARDGLEIHAFVSLPPGVSDTPPEPLPAVVMPHGGPTARDFAGFDPIVQFLTNRGYAVLQMNFRGSAGYGRAFKRAGERQWGEAMQDDVTDGVQWLIERGVVDADRICIVGGSYGGYVALMGAVKTPDMYQCAVSINGVSDLKKLMERNRRFSFGWITNNFIAGWGDGATLKKNSPAHRAKDIGVPILLVHSTKDSVVKYRQSEEMAKALAKAGKEYQFVSLENGDHNLLSGGVQPTMYRAMETFLAEHLQ